MHVRRSIAAILAMGISLALTGTALGVTTVSRSGNTFTVTGGDEVNYVEILAPGGDSGVVRFRDPGGLNFDPASCVDAGNFSADCGVAGPGLVANVNLGGGNDTFRPETIITTFPALVVDLGPGDDISWGSAGNDTINGGDGNDDINTRGGQDTIDGGPGNDRLGGAAGDDTITGGAGVDSLFGDGEFTGLTGFGNDTLKAQDGEIDSLSCSFGADTVIADAGDTFDVLGDCESRTIGGGATPPPPAPAALDVRVGAPTTPKLGALLSGKTIKTRITISSPCNLTVALVVRKAEAKRLKLGNKDVAIGAAAGNITAAGTYPASLSIIKKFRAKLRGQARVTVFLVALCEGPNKAEDIAVRKIVLKP